MPNMSSQRMHEEIMEISDEICTPWEIDFLEGITFTLNQGAELTAKQRAVLERIYEKACASAHEGATWSTSGTVVIRRCLRMVHRHRRHHRPLCVAFPESAS